MHVNPKCAAPGDLLFINYGRVYWTALVLSQEGDFMTILLHNEVIDFKTRLSIETKWIADHLETDWQILMRNGECIDFLK